MANIKLTGHTWDTSGIYDAEQEKTQAEVNSGLKTAVLQKFPYYSKSEYGTVSTEEMLSFPTTGLLKSVDGTVDASQTVYKTTDFVPLDGVTGIYRTGSTAQFALWTYCFYDENKIFLGSEAETTNYEIVEYDGKQVTWLDLSDYPTAKYIRISWSTTRTYTYWAVSGIPSYIYDVPQIIIGGKNVYNGIETVGDITIDVPNGDNLFNPDFTDGGYIDASNEVVEASNFKYTADYTEVDSIYHSTLYVKLSEQVDPFVFTFVKSNYDYITQIGVDSTSDTITIPANSKYFRVYTRKTFAGTVMISYTDTAYEEYSTAKKVPVSALVGNTGTVLKGKNVVFLGDSIFGNVQIDSGVANKFAELTGADVHNFAFGGTQATLHSGSTAYALAWQKFDGVSVASAIADNDYSDMEDAISSGDASDMPTYFSETVTALGSYDWTKCDYIIADWGTNDWTSGASIADYKSALAEIVSTILTAYPNIIFIETTPFMRFFNVGGTFYNSSVYDYREDGVYLKDFADAAIEELTAQPYSLQVIDCYNIGINDYTRTNFFTSPDWTHHNAKGRVRIATYLANEIA